MMKRNILEKLSFADSFTILNGVFGLIAIFLIIAKNFGMAFIFILLAVLADGMDGIMARRYGGYLGQYMDEFADIVSFLVAPCVFAFVYYGYAYLIFPSAFFLIFGILHLINYHLNPKDYFLGLTTPASAIVIGCAILLSAPVLLSFLLFIILSLLMVFPIPYPRIEKHFAIIACIVIFLAMSLIKEFIFLLLIFTFFYIIFGPFYLMKKLSL
ncbi:MAG TPA: hypothetical protein ENG71_04450 [Thermoplasmatales archaeon]|nr:hypothetical protein [Thermoplasmatales archaeon]